MLNIYLNIREIQEEIKQSGRWELLSATTALKKSQGRSFLLDLVVAIFSWNKKYLSTSQPTPPVLPGDSFSGINPPGLV